MEYVQAMELLLRLRADLSVDSLSDIFAGGKGTLGYLKEQGLNCENVINSLSQQECH